VIPSGIEPACCAVLKPTAPPRTPDVKGHSKCFENVKYKRLEIQNMAKVLDHEFLYMFVENIRDLKMTTQCGRRMSVV
jgi:hypothetical protein